MSVASLEEPLSNATAGWIEKQAEARKLLAEVKALNTEGIDTGEKATEAHTKMAEVQRLMGEVKAEKLAEEKAKLVELLEQYEKADPTDPSAGLSNGLIVGTTKGKGDHDHNGSRLILSTKAAGSLDMKALSSADGATGGFLVPPAYMQSLFAEQRYQGNALRRFGWLSEHPVTSNQVIIPVGLGGATVGVVAENTPKPSSDESFDQVTVNIFTIAGIERVSNQMLQDSSPTVVDLVTRALGAKLGIAEEQMWISGTGTGESRGILNTVGVPTTVVPASPTNAQSQIDAILDAIVSVQTLYYGAPTGILMHPRRLAVLQKAKDDNFNYIFNPAGATRAPGGLGSSNPGATNSAGVVAAMPTLFGLPVGISTNVPTNLSDGAATPSLDNDPVIVGAWHEAHVYQRQDVTLDVSDVAGDAFEKNQTHYRLEERVGFSAERYPQAFAVAVCPSPLA